MREIDGFVVIAKPPYYDGEILYGPRVHDYGEEKLIEPLKTNGLLPFNSIDRAQNVQRIFKDYDSIPAETAHFHLTIPENNVEEKTIEERLGLIVIEYSLDYPRLVILRGPRIEGRRSCYPIPGAYLEDNGYATWDNPDRAIYVRGEVIRQATNPAVIAQMKLDRIGSQGFLDLQFPSI